MSKFLKILVNTFLIAAILMAAAILIPPLAGVSTTIVDSASMNTNLPLGSITYSTNVNVSDLQVGDEVLKDNDISTYAYIIRSGDETTGQYRVVSAADPNGTEEEIYLRNSVPKVAVIVPYIGYIMIAMHSIEGIIILALAVILVIILFILSELWKPDEEEDDEETQEAVVSAGLSEANDSAIVDTETIRAAMEANVAAVNVDEVPEEEPSADGEEAPLTWAERRALKKAKKKEEKERRAQEKAAAEQEAEKPAAEESGQPEDASEPVPEAEPDENDVNEVWGSAVPAEEQIPSYSEEAPEEDVPVIDENAVSGETREFAPGGFNTGDIRAALFEAENAEALSSTDSLDDTKILPDPEGEMILKEAREEASGSGILYEEIPEEIQEASPDMPEIRIAEPEEFLKPEEIRSAEDAAPEQAVPEAEEELPGDRFAPVKRPSLTEMLDQAKASGESPLIVQDDQTGVTILDYSELL